MPYQCFLCKEEIKKPPLSCTTGYGVDKEGHKVCFKCCGSEDYRKMKNEDKITLYFVKEGKEFFVTNWPNSLRFEVSHIKESPHNFGLTRYDFWFTGPDGSRWWGFNIGENTQIAHCKKLKKKG